MCIDLYKDRVHVIGGGVIGLSVGWQLMRANIPTVVFDANKPKASSVAAGMLAPHVEALIENCPLFKVCQTSLSLFPQFLHELEQDCGITPSMHTCGTLLVGIDEDDARWLERVYLHSCQRDSKVYRLTGEEARDKEPLLSARVNHALWIPEDAYIDAQSLIQSLKMAFLGRGGEIIEEQIDKLPTNKTVIIAAGAWSANFGLPIRPLRGQIITLKAHTSLSCMIRSPRVYLTPGPLNTIRLGATSEELSFDLHTTGEGVRHLLQNSWEIVPALDHMSLLSINVGLRPLAYDRSPLVGRSKKEGVFHATGHGRSGFLLAPFTAYKLKEEVYAYITQR